MKLIKYEDEPSFTFKGDDGKEPSMNVYLHSKLIEELVALPLNTLCPLQSKPTLVICRTQVNQVNQVNQWTIMNESNGLGIQLQKIPKRPGILHHPANEYCVSNNPRANETYGNEDLMEWHRSTFLKTFLSDLSQLKLPLTHPNPDPAPEYYSRNPGFGE